MKKHIANAGYKFKSDYNDMTDKEFYLSEALYEDSEHSLMGGLKFNMQETYVLFLKSFDASAFRSKLESILNNANSGGLCAALGNSVTAERQENGYMITMNFTIKGA